MTIFDKKFEVKEKELIEEGTYPARVYLLVDMGTHDAEWEGVIKPKHTVKIGFELIGTKMEDGRPFVVTKDFTLSNGIYGTYIAKTSNLHKLLKSWLKFDEKKATYVDNLPEIVGSPALISIGVKPSMKDKSKSVNCIEGILPYKGKELPKAVNEKILYGLGESRKQPGAGFDKLYPWMQKQISECHEWCGKTGKTDTSVANKDDGTQEGDIPF